MTSPLTPQQCDEHHPEPWFWEAGADECPHGPEPERDTDAWDQWIDHHQGSPQGVYVCPDAPAGDMCAACSEDHGAAVAWSVCTARPRAARTTDTPAEPSAEHRPETVPGGSLECVERECDEFFTDDGDEIEGKTTCSHMTEMEICVGCTAANGKPEDLPPAVPWADCPHRTAPASV